jgi:hypothetical protein
MNTAVAHYYRMFRGNMERTAESAYESARRHVAFRRRLDEMVKDSKRRSRAAKLGHRRRNLA